MSIGSRTSNSFANPTMRFHLLIIFLFLSICSFAQENVLLTGQVRDMTTGHALPGVHVINLGDSAATISDLQGIFRIPVQIGDSIAYSSIGFTERVYLITDSLLGVNPFYVGMAPQVYQLGEVTVNPLGSKAQFRKEFMDLNLADDKLEIDGLINNVERDFPVWEDAEEIKKLKYALNPISYLYYNFNKRAKSRQEYRRLVSTDHKRDEARAKFDTLAVSKYTGLKGDSLFLFMNFCALSETFLYRASSYDIMLVVQKKFAQFTAVAERKDED
jgi:hypothetical protein